MRISILAACSCALAAAITLAGCGGDGSQSQQGLNPNLVGSAKSATTSATQFKWFSATKDFLPGQHTAVVATCNAPFTRVVARGYY
jgi:hypothetical protein